MGVRYIRPEFGQVYTLRNGGDYRCMFVSNADQAERGECSAVLVRESDGWQLIAHGIQQNDDGTIEWNYSTGGHWTSGKTTGRIEVWQDCELGQTYKVKEFDNELKAAAWIRENERYYPGWHLRIAWEVVR